MIFAEFSNVGYTCIDEYNRFKYSEDTTHKFLFEFITKDLSELPILFDEYFSKRFDTTNWRLKKYNVKDEDEDKKDFLKIQQKIASIHPFYKYNGDYAIATEIAEYFNQLSFHYRYKFDRKRYSNIISKLLPSEILRLSPDIYDAYYNDYCARMDPSIDKNSEVLLFGGEPVWLNNEREAQKTISDMLYYILDITAQGGLEKLSIPQRALLYECISSSPHENINAPFLKQPLSIRTEVSFVPHNFQKEFAQTETPDFSNIKSNGLPESALSYLSQQKITTSFFHYEIDRLIQLLYLEIVSMINANIMVRKCKNCGKYFVVSNRKIAYCNRIDPSGKCCSSIGSTRSFQQKLEHDEALKVYTRAYKTHYARVKKGTMSKSDFSKWCAEAKTKLEKARTGELDITDFQKWLKI